MDVGRGKLLPIGEAHNEPLEAWNILIGEVEVTLLKHHEVGQEARDEVVDEARGKGRRLIEDLVRFLGCEVDRKGQVILNLHWPRG